MSAPLARLAWATLLAIGCAATASPGVAAPIGFALSGTVTTAIGAFAGAGPGLTATFAIDDAIGDTNADPQLGVYPMPGTLAFVAGAIAGAVAFDRVEIADAASDQFRVAGSLAPIGSSSTVTVLLIDSDGVAFASDAMPGALPAIGLFETAILRIDTALNGVPLDVLIATITSIERSDAVPIPATPALLAPALAALAALRSRRTKIDPA